jgi:DNA-binding NtrC family response regulator
VTPARDAMESPLPDPMDASPVEPDADASGTVLMVDDNPDVLELGAMVLREAGFTVIAAASAEEALESVRDGSTFDLLFTDIVMPGGMDGVALASEIRSLKPGTPVLLTTGWADRAAEQIGQSDYDLIGKPYRPIDLVRRVRALLAGHSGGS